MADYTQRSYDEILDLITEQAAELFPGFTLDESTLTGLIAQIVAALYDQNAFFIDRRAEASYLETAVLQQDVRKLVRNLGIEASFLTGATADLTFTYDASVASVTIPKGSNVSSTNGETYSTTAALTLTTGTPSDDVQAVHGEYLQKAYVAGASPTQVFEFLRDDVLEQFISITKNGSSYTDFTLEFDDSDLNTLVMNNLELNDYIVIDFFFGGGDDGNSASIGDINSLDSSFTDSDTITAITNAARPTGGKNLPTISEIKSQVSGFIEQVDAILSNADPTGALQRNSSTSFIQGATVQRDFDDDAGGTGKPLATLAGFAAGDSIEDLTSTQISNIAAFLAQSGEFGVEWSVSSAVGAPVQLEMDVKIENQSARSEKEQEIKDYLVGDDGIYKTVSATFDRSVTHEAILEAESDIAGVTRINIAKLTKKPQGVVTKGTYNQVVEAYINRAQDENGVWVFPNDNAGSVVGIEYWVPFKPTQVGASFARDENSNFLRHEEQHDIGTDLDDTPTAHKAFFKDDLAGTAVLFRPDLEVANTGEYTGEAHLVRVSFYDDINSTQQTGYYRVLSIDIGENTWTLGTTPESGYDLIADLGAGATIATADYSNINFQILRDVSTVTAGSELYYNDKQRLSLASTHNDADTIYFDGVTTVDQSYAIGTPYFLKVRAESDVAGVSTDPYFSPVNGGVGARLQVDGLAGGDETRMYVTAYNGAVSWKHPREVLTLDRDDIVIRFI